jgi:hypothetical protein
MHTNTIAESLSGLSVGEPTVFEHLAAYPLLGPASAGSEYLTLEQALAAKSARITEVSESGSVPELLFVNEGETPVLLLDGEELVGAKQNRILNLTILVAAKSELVIPVSCVERGRWSRRSEEFASAKRAMYAEARARKMEEVSMAMAVGGSRRANQGSVWSSVADKASRMNVRSHTEAMSEIYEDRQQKLDDYVRAFCARGGQRGAVFCMGGRVAGLELFDRPDTFRSLFPALVQSYALDAMEGRFQGDAPGSEAIGHLMLDISEADTQRFEAIGMGHDLRFRSTRVSGAALEADGRIVHLLAYARSPLGASGGGGEDATVRRARVVSFSQRRRRQGH